MCFFWLCHSPIHVFLSTLTMLHTNLIATTPHLRSIGTVKLLHRHRCGCRHRHRRRFISFLHHLLALLIFIEVTGMWGRTQNTWPHQGFGYFDLTSDITCASSSICEKRKEKLVLVVIVAWVNYLALSSPLSSSVLEEHITPLVLLLMWKYLNLLICDENVGHLTWLLNIVIYFRMV